MLTGHSESLESHSEKLELLNLITLEGVLSQTEGYGAAQWTMSEFGCRTFPMAYQLGNMSLPMSLRDVDLKSLTTWDIMEWLKRRDFDGMSCETRKQLRKAKPMPYIGSEAGNRRWYIKLQDEDCAHHYYLLALATA